MRKKERVVVASDRPSHGNRRTKKSSAELQIEFIKHERELLANERRLFDVRKQDLKEQENSFRDKVWRASQLRFRVFLDFIPCLMCHVNEHQCFGFCNTPFALFFDVLPQQVVGKRLWDIVDVGDYDAMRPHMIRALQGEEVTFEISFQSKPRRYFHVKLLPDRTRDQAPKLQLAGFSILLLDITDRKEHEEQQKANEHKFRQLAEERAELLKQQETLLEEAEQASRLKDNFLATLSHELRTPLTSLIGWAALMKGKNVDESKRAIGMMAIERNAKVQAKLIDDLLDISRMVNDKVRLRMSKVDLTRLIHQVVDSMRPSITEKTLNIKIDAPARKLPRIDADSNRIQQVINNLFSNAVKFTPPHGNIEISAQRLSGTVQITVQDTGPGIPTEFLPHLFKEFRQADMSASRTKMGLGLGLSIARRLVELHGGSIHAENNGQTPGARFIVRLPLQR